jgi:hypothetical protein
MVHGYGYYTPGLQRVCATLPPERTEYSSERASAGKNLKTWITKSNLELTRDLAVGRAITQAFQHTALSKQLSPPATP